MQSFKDFEIIVVIDGSTDNTFDILDSYKDNRISIIKKEQNAGLPATLNTGLTCSKGKYWTWTSDDNLYMDDTLKVLVDYLETHPAMTIVSPYLYHIDEEGKTRFLSNSNLNCFLCKRESAVAIGGFRVEYMLVEDADFFLRMTHFYGPIARIAKPYYKFRDHPKSLSYTQIQKRQYISTLMHYDLITKGIEKADLMELFFDRLKIAALYRGYEWMDKIVEFAKKNNLSFNHELERTSIFYKTQLGWIYVKLSVVLASRLKYWSRPCYFMDKILHVRK
jgi:glycosyltransferase involved in cell wall biosynthesis